MCIEEGRGRKGMKVNAKEGEQRRNEGEGNLTRKGERREIQRKVREGRRKRGGGRKQGS